MLTIENAQIRQGDFQLNANISFPLGEMTALIGPSGAGKSTLLMALAGFLNLDQGAVCWEGQDVTQLAPADRPMSILFQDNNLFPHLTVMQNVGLALRTHLGLSAIDRQQVYDVLTQVGLQGFENQKPANLSGGQQSRAALARVLLADRPVVLLDEPFAALGPGLKAEMLDLTRAKLIDAGKTVIMITHDPDDAKRVADQIALVSDNHVQPPVITKQIFAAPPAALQAYLGS